MAEHMDIEDIRPVAPLGLIVHDSCRELGYAVDKRLAEYRRHQDLKNRDSGVFFGYADIGKKCNSTALRLLLCDLSDRARSFPMRPFLNDSRILQQGGH